MCSVYVWERFLFEKMAIQNCDVLYLLTVALGSENQKDAQRSCDQFPGSIVSRCLF